MLTLDPLILTQVCVELQCVSSELAYSCGPAGAKRSIVPKASAQTRLDAELIESETAHGAAGKPRSDPQASPGQDHAREAVRYMQAAALSRGLSAVDVSSWPPLNEHSCREIQLRAVLA